jgi:hypothetical protein
MMPLSRSLKIWPLCVPAGNLEIRFAFECRHGHLSAERGEREGDRELAVEIVFVALKDGMLFHVDDDVEIARRTPADSRFAIVGRAQARAFGDSGRDLQLDAARLLDAAFAFARTARFLDDLAYAAATRTRLRDLKETPRADDPAHARRTSGN